jgi:hypothetical protein
MFMTERTRRRRSIALTLDIRARDGTDMRTRARIAIHRDQRGDAASSDYSSCEQRVTY